MVCDKDQIFFEFLDLSEVFGECDRLDIDLLLLLEDHLVELVVGDISEIDLTVGTDCFSPLTGVLLLELFFGEFVEVWWFHRW